MTLSGDRPSTHDRDPDEPTSEEKFGREPLSGDTASEGTENVIEARLRELRAMADEMERAMGVGPEGRPPLGPVRGGKLTDEEAERFDQRVREAGMTTSTYIRRLIRLDEEGWQSGGQEALARLLMLAEAVRVFAANSRELPDRETFVASAAALRETAEAIVKPFEAS